MKTRSPRLIDTSHTYYGLPLRTVVLLAGAGFSALLAVIGMMSAHRISVGLWVSTALILIACAVLRADRLTLDQWLIRTLRARRRPRHYDYRLPGEIAPARLRSSRPSHSACEAKNQPQREALSPVKSSSHMVHLGPLLGGSLLIAAVSVALLLHQAAIAPTVAHWLGVANQAAAI